jgi:hypothetical protein
MGNLAVWKVLEEMVIELRKKGLTVPSTVMNDLKSARTMIKIMNADASRSEITQKVDEYLGNVKSYIVTEAQKEFAPEYIDAWLRRLEEANCEIRAKVVDEESRFIAGLPRDQKWIRVKPLTSLSVEKLKQLAEESNLSCSIQEDGRLLVYGKAEDIKEFVKKMTKETCRG